MIRRSDITVSDALGTPEGGVYITVKDDTGALATLYDDAAALKANPFTSDAVTGAFYYNIADADAGAFTEEYRLSLSDSPRTIRAVTLDLSAIGVWANVKSFGATGLGIADDSAAFVAALAYLKAQAVNDLGYNLKASSRLYVPPGHYFLGTTTLDITHTLTIEGDGTGQAGGGACRLRWTAGTTGIRLQHKNTSGASTYDAVAHFGADGSTIRGLWLDGGFAGTESEAHGIHAKVRFTAEDCIIESFPGDGIYSNVVAGSGGAFEGNANCSTVNRVRIVGCRNGVFLDGADTNVWSVKALDVSGNRQWGALDSGFLQNEFELHAASNGYGLFGNGTTTPVSLVSHLGKYYSLMIGGNANNTPSGTTDHTADWAYSGVGGPGASFPTWVSGLNVRPGGCYASDNANAKSVWNCCYDEGSQGPSQVNAPAILLNGQHGAGVAGTGLHIRVGSSGQLVTGPEGGVRDYSVEQNSSGSHNFLLFYNWSAGVRTLAGYLDARPGFGLEFYDINGNKVVGTRKTGWATATGTATRTTFDTATVTLPQLAQRLKALIDDLHGVQIGT